MSTLRAAFNMPIRGVYELVELLLAGTFFLALPAVFLRDENILVNVDRRLRAALGAAAQARRGAAGGRRARGHGVAGLIAARDSLEFNDVTADLGLPRFWHWLRAAGRRDRRRASRRSPWRLRAGATAR